MTRRRQPPKDKDPNDEFRSAKPAPSRRDYAPTPEEWAAWCQAPCTEWVAAAFAAKAVECRAMWSEQSWQKGVPDPNLLIELRTRADNFEAFLTADFRDYTYALSKNR